MAAKLIRDEYGADQYDEIDQQSESKIENRLDDLTYDCGGGQDDAQEDFRTWIKF